MGSSDEVEVAKQISTLIRLAVQQTGSLKAAGARLHTIGVEVSADAGVEEQDLHQRQFQIFRERERRDLGE